MKYRKKPIEIEAMQFDGSEESADQIIAWVHHNGGSLAKVKTSMGTFCDKISGLAGADDNLYVVTATGWVLRGIEGEFYPCQDSIFSATYDVVNEPPSIDEPDYVCQTCRDTGRESVPQLYPCSQCQPAPPAMMVPTT